MRNNRFTHANTPFKVNRVKSFSDDDWFVGKAKSINEHNPNTYRIVYEIFDVNGNKYKDCSFWLPVNLSEDNNTPRIDTFWQVYGDDPTEEDIVGKTVDVYVEMTIGSNDLEYWNVVEFK